MVSDPTNETAIRERALNLLARREHAPAELQRKLLSRGFDADAVAAVLHDLEQANLLSSQRYVEARVRQGISRGDGPRKIQARLKQAGVEPASSAEFVDEAGDAVDWLAQARALCQRRFGEDPPPTRKDWARRARFLSSRGYTEDVVRKVLGGIPRL